MGLWLWDFLNYLLVKSFIIFQYIEFFGMRIFNSKKVGFYRVLQICLLPLRKKTLIRKISLKNEVKRACKVLWVNRNKGLSEKLHKASENRAVRTLTSASYDSNLDDLFQELVGDTLLSKIGTEVYANV